MGESTTIEAEQAEKADLERKKEQAQEKLDKIALRRKLQMDKLVDN